MAQEYVFRFVTVRPGNQREKVRREAKILAIYDTARPTELGATLKKL